MDDQFDHFVRHFLRPVAVAAGGGALSIKMDVREDNKTYLVDAEMPGAKKADIKVEIDGNQVSISAEAKIENDVKDDKQTLRSECYYGNVFRSFALGQEIDEDAAGAKYENGVLSLTLPKAAMPKTRMLTIN